MARNVLVPVSRQKRRFVYELQHAYPFELPGSAVNAIRFADVSMCVGAVSTFHVVIAGGVELIGEIGQSAETAAALGSSMMTIIGKGEDG